MEMGEKFSLVLKCLSTPGMWTYSSLGLVAFHVLSFVVTQRLIIGECALELWFMRRPSVLHDSRWERLCLLNLGHHITLTAEAEDVFDSFRQ